MILSFPASILAHERRTWGRAFTDDDIIKAARKVVHGIGHKIGVGIMNSQLVKIDITTQGGHGRSLFVLHNQDGHIAPLLIRPKSDKKVGENLSPTNPAFAKELAAAYQRLTQDAETDNYTRDDVVL